MDTLSNASHRAASILPDESQDPRIIEVLTGYYGLSTETAEELVTELSDLRSLSALAYHRGGAGRASLTAHKFIG